MSEDGSLLNFEHATHSERAPRDEKPIRSVLEHDKALAQTRRRGLNNTSMSGGRQLVYFPEHAATFERAPRDEKLIRSVFKHDEKPIRSVLEHNEQLDRACLNTTKPSSECYLIRRLFTMLYFYFLSALDSGKALMAHTKSLLWWRVAEKWRGGAREQKISG